MVSVQAECDLQDAFVMLQERAESTAKNVEEIAEAVVDRRMRFAPRAG